MVASFQGLPHFCCLVFIQYIRSDGYVCLGSLISMFATIKCSCTLSFSITGQPLLYMYTGTMMTEETCSFVIIIDCDWGCSGIAVGLHVWGLVLLCIHIVYTTNPDPIWAKIIVLINEVSLFRGKNNMYLCVKLGLGQVSWLTKVSLFKRCPLREFPLYT